MSEPYRIEVEVGGCERCGQGKYWNVVDPNDVAIGVLFENEDEAADLARMLNDAYVLGQQDPAEPTP